MKLEAGPLSFDWVDGWARVPDDELARTGWAHVGIATLGDGVVTGHPGEGTLVFLDWDGRTTGTARTDLIEVHSIRVVHERGEARLWSGDIATKFKPELNYEPWRAPEGGRVVQLDLDGRIRRELPHPQHELYEEKAYRPTQIAPVEENGDVWVADGYGAHLVHRYDAGGNQIGTLTGDEGAGRYDCPHGILVDRRKDEPELYVTDRANSRIQVYDLEGSFKRSFGDDVLTAPTDMVTLDEFLVLTDFMRSRLSVFDADDRLVGHLGENPGVQERDGWPNAKTDAGDLERPTLEPGHLNSPHTLAADAQGNLYVTEWLIGGRYTKLARKR